MIKKSTHRKEKKIPLRLRLATSSSLLFLLSIAYGKMAMQNLEEYDKLWFNFSRSGCQDRKKYKSLKKLYISAEKIGKSLYTLYLTVKKEDKDEQEKLLDQTTCVIHLLNKKFKDLRQLQDINNLSSTHGNIIQAIKTKNEEPYVAIKYSNQKIDLNTRACSSLDYLCKAWITIISGCTMLVLGGVCCGVTYISDIGQDPATQQSNISCSILIITMSLLSIGFGFYALHCNEYQNVNDEMSNFNDHANEYKRLLGYN
jgi:hypothetical protein